MSKDRLLCAQCEQVQEAKAFAPLARGRRRRICKSCDAEAAKIRYQLRTYGSMDLSNQWLRRAIL